MVLFLYNNNDIKILSFDDLKCENNNIFEFEESIKNDNLNNMLKRYKRLEDNWDNIMKGE